ncbi:MAG TPA: hypothetical protein VEG60_25725 [Candidatus Binatia bacterium]|nr:hypothetical protein [Candidatus Binatia bacterium]
MILVIVLGAAIYFADRQNWIDVPGIGSDSGRDLSRRNAPANAVTIFSGRASELRAAPGNRVDVDPSDSTVAWIRSTVKSASPGGETDGVAVPVPSSVWSGITANRIRVTVSAKGGGGEPNPFALTYSTGSTQNSGWLVFEPTSAFKDYSFVFAVPPASRGTTHYVGIWSDITGRSTPLALRRVEIAPLP